MKRLIAVCLILGTCGAGAAQAQTLDASQLVAAVIERNAVQRDALASRLACGAVAASEATELEARQADLYRMEALALDAGAAPRDLLSVARVQDHLLATEAAHACTRPARDPALQATREPETAVVMRDADQQRAIARGWAAGRLSLAQLAQLEANQAQLSRLQAVVDQGDAGPGAPSVWQAQRLLHLRNLQDWAIASGRDPF